MDTRSSAIRMVAAFFIAMVISSVGFSNPIHIYGGDFNLPIPANPDDTNGWMADAVIEIPDHFIITDIDVQISLEHTSAFDLQIYLQGPDGNEICLNMYNYDEFFVGANYTNTIFDDEAPIFIKDGNAPFTGRFRPVEELSEFDSRDAYGSWRLRIYDAFYYDTGIFKRLDLMISAPEPSITVLLTFGAVLLGLVRPRRG